MVSFPFVHPPLQLLSVPYNTISPVAGKALIYYQTKNFKLLKDYADNKISKTKIVHRVENIVG